jgi:hypothetical protein
MTYTAYLMDVYHGIHGKGEGFASEADAMAWAERELPKVKRRVHFGDKLGIRIEIIEKVKEMANV